MTLNPYQPPLQTGLTDPAAIASGESTRRMNAGVLAGLVYGLTLAFVTGAIVLLFGPYKFLGPGHVLINTFLVGLPIGGVAALLFALWSLLSLAVRVCGPNSIRPYFTRRRLPASLFGAIAAGVVFAATFVWFCLGRGNFFSAAVALPVGAYGYIFAWGDNGAPNVLDNTFVVAPLSLFAHLCAGALAGAIFDLQTRFQNVRS